MGAFPEAGCAGVCVGAGVMGADCSPLCSPEVATGVIAAGFTPSFKGVIAAGFTPLPQIACDHLLRAFRFVHPILPNIHNHERQC